MPAGDSSDYRRWLDWLEKQGKSSDQRHYWTEEEIEPIISDYLRGAEHYGGMIARLRCLKPKSLEKQCETYTKRDVDDAYIEGMASAKRELEKQDEQKPTIEMKTPEESLGINSDTYNEIVDECIYGEQKSQRMISAEAKEAMYGKPSGKVEPKFKVGDWVVYYRNDSSREVLQVYDIRDGRYYFTDNVHFSWSVKECDEKSHLWTISDARDGDVIACENGRIGIFKCLNDNLFSSYCFIDNEGWFCGDEGQVHMLDTIICGEIYPATKEQRDLLFSKMNEAGYEWDAEKKELKKIEQKSAWSEEDDVMIYKLLAVVELYYDRDGDDLDKQSCISFLKSIKNKVLPKQEWSEEDENRLSDAVFFVREYQIPTRDKRLLNAAKEAEEWLKSLKERIGR